MNLLILTQKVDREDPILGFFHRWLEEFAKHCDKVTVICLFLGNYDLPKNVKVLSLGKEEQLRKRPDLGNFKRSVLGEQLNRLKYIWHFYKYIWQERKNYDSVFVHMNQEYVLLGGLIWRLFSKKVMLWRNHPDGSFLTRVAVFLSDRVFCTSKFSFTAQFKKTEIMPVGIDTDFFKPDPSIAKIPRSILFLGRISPIKRPDLLIEALRILKENGEPFKCSIVGDPLERDEEYYNSLKKNVEGWGLEEMVTFYPAVTNEQTRDLYNQHEIFVNLTPSGSMDKTIFEAMACGCLVLGSNNNLRGEIDDTFLFEEGGVVGLSKKLEYILGLSLPVENESQKSLRQYCRDKHGLGQLVSKLINIS